MTDSASTRITVFGAERDDECSVEGTGAEGSCAGCDGGSCTPPQWSPLEAYLFLERELGRKYADKVWVEFIDLDDDNNAEKFAGLIQAVEQRGLQYPLVAIDGEIKMAGGFDLDAICDEIEMKDAVAADAPAD